MANRIRHSAIRLALGHFLPNHIFCILVFPYSEKHQLPEDWKMDIHRSKFSEPEPHLVLYRRSLENKHPEPPDIYLVVEVSDSSLPIDSGEKLRAYQECGVPEYWIIDLAKKVIRVHTLKDGRYQDGLHMMLHGANNDMT